MSDMSDSMDGNDYKRANEDIENQNFATDQADLVNAVDPTRLPDLPTPTPPDHGPPGHQPHNHEPGPNEAAPEIPHRTLEESKDSTTTV